MIINPFTQLKDVKLRQDLNFSIYLYLHEITSILYHSVLKSEVLCDL